jgi:hypothetical protein
MRTRSATRPSSARGSNASAKMVSASTYGFSAVYGVS